MSRIARQRRLSMSQPLAPVAITTMSLIGWLAGQAHAQCQLVARDSFRLGERPHGGNGQLRDAQVHDTLKDYWPQVPSTGDRWLAADQNGVTTWAFAAASLDPAEVDSLDPFNGVAFGEAPATALLPFLPPAEPFTISAEVVMLSGSTSATYLGYTSAPALASNFETFGTLWMSINGSGEWTVRVNGSNIVASGTASYAGTFDSGWLHVDLRFDPVTSVVSGHVMGTVVPPTPVTLTRPITHLGMEAHESWNVLNNLSVFTGPGVGASAIGGGQVSPGTTVSLTASTNAAPPSVVRWTRTNGWPLSDGTQPGGSFISGSQTTTLEIANISLADSGAYRCVVANDCGYALSEPVTLVVATACYPNCDNSTAAPVLTANDFQCFLNKFAAGDVAANCDASTASPILTANDFQCFLNRFAAGCN